MAGLQYYDIIDRPVITEKSLNMLPNKKYSFFVHPDSTKIQIKEAVEKMFEGVKVLNVNTMNYKGKPKSRGRTTGFTSKKKKAVVTLAPDSREIVLFQGM